MTRMVARRPQDRLCPRTQILRRPGDRRPWDLRNERRRDAAAPLGSV